MLTKQYKDTYEYVLEFIKGLDGEILSCEDKYAPAYECVQLTVENDGELFELHIFSAGYIGFGGFDYFVGVAEVENLISVVVLAGDPAPGYYWDEQNWCRKNGNPDEPYPPVSNTEYETFSNYTIPIEDVETETATEFVIETEEEPSA